jgi:glycosyltransferase involved in cell wall biosynthesis
MQTALFIIPVFSQKHDVMASKYLDDAIQAIKQQSDTDWHIAIVDDASTCPVFTHHLAQLANTHPTQITLLRNPDNAGPGVSRNQAIQWADAHGYPFVLFNDSDDLSHPDRLKIVRQHFNRRAEVSVVYSSFNVIDEHGHPVAESSTPPSIREIIAASAVDPVEGEYAWIKILTEKKGYVNLTSATSVRTSLEAKCLFPAEYVSEDAVTWLKYSACGGQFAFIPDTPSQYRIQLAAQQRQTQQREGSKARFFQQVVTVNEQGVRQCIAIGLKSRTISTTQAAFIYSRYAQNMADVLTREHLPELAEAMRTQRVPDSIA